jgi:hypothetical protein
MARFPGKVKNAVNSPFPCRLLVCFLPVLPVLAGLALTACGSPSSAKAITALGFGDIETRAVINETDRTVIVYIPYGADRRNLVPAVKVSPGASLSPASGTRRDFTANAAYTVTAKDGSTADWTVTVREAAFSVDAAEAWLSSASGGSAAPEPVPLAAAVDLSSGWASLLSAIDRAGKYAALDLSVCEMAASAEVFDPGTTRAGKKYIVSLELPGTATLIANGV